MQKMNNMAIVLSIVLCIQITTSFQLQGAWSLTQIQDSPTLYESVTVQITDTVFRNTSILQNITFSGCQTYKYFMETNQNNIFVRYSSIQYDTKSQEAGNTTVKCLLNAAKMHSVIRSKLVEVFYFQIVGNFLVFLSPNREIVFQFQRIQTNKVRSLRGIWNLYSLKSTSVSQKVEIADTQITLCKGKLILGYSLTQKYGFKTRIISNDGCDVPDMDTTFLSSTFTKRIGTSLEVYNSALDVVMLMSFVEDLDLSAAQQARLKAIEEAKLNEDKAAKASAEAQQKARVDAQAQAKLQAQQITTSLTLTNIKDDLLGLWQPITIFNIPMESSSIYFIISSNVISYNGGCNTFQFQYSLPQSNLQQIQIGQNKSTSNNCDVNDDGLYVNGIGKISSYGMSIVGKDFRLQLKDQAGNVIYEMKKTVNVQNGTTTAIVVTQNQSQSTPVSNSQNSTIVNSSVLPALQTGRYVFLVLARRDLPRRFCTITDTKIAYTGCNTIEHTYTLTSSNQIKISGGTSTSTNKCTVNNDEIISNAFNSITSFIAGQETGSYVLRNAKNQDVLNLSQF